ncbi:MAG: GGDEF domain-containing protein [Treponemataceae bacterium]|nr:GGDEF domain-containing protein [Treponemataceae bacterium]
MRMKKVLFIFFASSVLIFSGLFSVVYFDWYFIVNESIVEEPPLFEETIIVVADYDYSPYSFFDEEGKATGYDIDFMKAVSSKIKKNIEICLLPWNEAEYALESGSADVLLGLEVASGISDNTAQFKNYRFSIPTGNDSFMLFGKKPVENFGLLYSSRIAVIRDAGLGETFLYDYKLIDNAVFFSNYTEVFQAVSEGSCDFALCRYSVGKLLADSVDTSIKVAFSPLINVSNSYAVLAGNEELLTEINDAIIELAKDGTMNRIETKWMDNYVRFSNLWELIEGYSVFIICFFSIMVLCLLFIILYYGTRNVRQQDEKNFRIRIEEKDVFLDIYNRRGVEQRMKEEFRSEGSSLIHAVFIVNINNFRTINDKYGYEKGNDVLRNMGQLLKSSFREKDCIGRLRSDEFIVLMVDARSEVTVMAKAERLYQAILDFYNFTELQGAVSASIGVAIYPQHGNSPDILIKNAAKALSIAKRRNREKGDCVLYGVEATSSDS